jgi:hypothetical protein
MLRRSSLRLVGHINKFQFSTDIFPWLTAEDNIFFTRQGGVAKIYIIIYH